MNFSQYWFSYSEIRGIGDKEIEIQKTTEYLYLKDWVGLLLLANVPGDTQAIKMMLGEWWWSLVKIPILWMVAISKETRPMDGCY